MSTKHGGTIRDGGFIHLDRGVVRERTKPYSTKFIRDKIIKTWIKDVKNLDQTEPFYITIEPNTK